MTYIATLFRQARTMLGLRPVEIARQAGYRNVAKGIRRVTNIEDGTDMFPKPAVYQRFLPILGLDECDVFQAMALDFEALDQPVPPRLIVRIIPSFYVPRDLPEGVSLDEAIAFARKVSAEEGHSVCVTLTRIRGLYIWPDGKESEGYGLPINNLPFLESVRASYPGKTLKEQFLLFKELGKTPRKQVSPGVSTGSR